MASLNLSFVELGALVVCSIIFGAVLLFFFTSRRSLKNIPSEEHDNLKKTAEEWKMKYFNEVEVKEEALAGLQNKLDETEDANNIYLIEIEELKKQNKKHIADLANNTSLQTNASAAPAETKTNYFEQLKQAQNSLLAHNEKINQLLEQIDVIKENEEKQKLIEEEKEELEAQVMDLKMILGQKEQEIHKIKQAEHLTKEMTSMLDSAYGEFNALQSKIQKLESQVNAGKMVNIEYEDLKEAYIKSNRELDEHKTKLLAITKENQQLTLELHAVEDKYNEANFQRQQLQKKVSYLEELNSDLHLVSEANKKLENQIRRIGELESKLNIVSEERDSLLRRSGEV